MAATVPERITVRLAELSSFTASLCWPANASTRAMLAAIEIAYAHGVGGDTEDAFDATEIVDIEY